MNERNYRFNLDDVREAIKFCGGNEDKLQEFILTKFPVTLEDLSNNYNNQFKKIRLSDLPKKYKDCIPFINTCLNTIPGKSTSVYGIIINFLEHTDEYTYEKCFSENIGCLDFENIEKEINERYLYVCDYLIENKIGEIIYDRRK